MGKKEKDSHRAQRATPKDHPEDTTRLVKYVGRGRSIRKTMPISRKTPTEETSNSKGAHRTIQGTVYCKICREGKGGYKPPGDTMTFKTSDLLDPPDKCDGKPQKATRSLRHATP